MPSQNGGGGWSPSAGFLIQVGPKHPSDPPMRLDINPECLTSHGFTHMRNTLTGIIGVDWHWVQLARVTRVDTALDVQGYSTNSWAQDMTDRLNNQVHPVDREMRTISLGEEHGDRLVIYDSEGVFRTRIEFQKRNAGPVQELAGMACPFANLLIFDPSSIQNLAEPLRSAMLTVGPTKGIEGVSALFPSSYRAECWNILTAGAPDWWKPHQIWKEWSIMLQACLPGLFG